MVTQKHMVREKRESKHEGETDKDKARTRRHRDRPGTGWWSTGDGTSTPAVERIRGLGMRLDRQVIGLGKDWVRVWTGTVSLTEMETVTVKEMKMLKETGTGARTECDGTGAEMETATGLEKDRNPVGDWGANWEASRMWNWLWSDHGN